MKIQPTWIYKGQAYTQADADSIGFVYLITNTQLNKRYIGKKQFWSVKKLPPLKGRKRKRHQLVETDWRDYWGSSESLLKDIELYGVDCFSREILELCENKTTLAYQEAKLQFAHDVLRRDDYYNGIINCRVTAKGLR